MTPEALAITYGLSSALAWGAGDFSGGLATKRASVFTVILFSQAVGAALLTAVSLLLSENVPCLRDLILGGIAGISGVLGLTALYSGLASGRMGVVAPVSAVTTAVIPILFGMFLEGLPKSLQLMGFGLAILAVCALSYTADAKRTNHREISYGLAAGLGFGFYFIFIDSAVQESVFWPLVAARIASMALMSAIVLARRKFKGPHGIRWSLVALVGILDTAGNTFFALATQVGRLDVSAVLSSLYPAATVLLAWLVLKEKLQGHQWAGVLTACAALVLIAL